jgi:trk system potassium uptake protein TrkA
MIILIAGGGKLGANLAVNMQAAGHEVIVVEQQACRVDRLREVYPDMNVVHGDACEPVVLETAHVRRADAVAAVTGDDEDNLVVCLLARREYEVDTTAARINDPRNEWLFDQRFGVDHTVSSVTMMTEILTREVGSSL